MTQPDPAVADLRTDFVENLTACRDTERELFAALDPHDRDAAPAGGGWSAKDELAHLSAWRRREADVMAARREGRAKPGLPAAEIDETNALFHAERADWSWAQVDADADATASALIAEIVAADDETLADMETIASIMGDGPEHDLAHLARISEIVGMGQRVVDLAGLARAMIDRGGWPTRSAAFGRYNLACFHAQGGRLDIARSLLRQALPAEEELRSLAPRDDDLIALRDEIPGLIGP
ncbi:MAG: DinB family protein [Candidatus Limnocylindrales bacterium]